jgi:hypothetical protein
MKENLRRGNINMEDTTEQILIKMKTNIIESTETVLEHQPRNQVGSVLMKTGGTQCKSKTKPAEST